MTSARWGAVLATGVASTAALAWARRHFMVVTVRGTSMAPTYADGQRLLLRRGGYTAGDVVMFRSPVVRREGLQGLVKRVEAVPGDPVPADMAARAGVPVVPPGWILVRSDAGGLDSRELGLINQHDVIGRACPSRPLGLIPAP
jgi:signal peptidase I